MALTLKIRYFAILREGAGRSEELLHTEAKTPSELYHELAERFAWSLSPALIKVAINARYESLDTPLKNGDELVFIPPVSGG